MFSETDYNPVERAESEPKTSIEDYEDSIDSHSRFPRQSRYRRFKERVQRLTRECREQRSISLVISTILPWTLTLVLSWFLLHQYSKRGPSNPLFPQVVYSPAQDVLRYESHVQFSGFGGDVDHRFQGEPSPEIDANWDSLYQFAQTKLNRYEAAHIPNKTWPIASEPGHYIAVLDVFHHLHCLNMIRKALRPDYYNQTHWSDDIKEDELLGISHLGHCVDSIRQSLMCMSDISVIPWQWDLRDKKAKPVGNIVHTCRNFDAIKDWAMERKFEGELDLNTFSDDPLAGVLDWKMIWGGT